MKIARFSLAPIHEYTNAAFRLISERHKCKMTFVPLVNVTAVSKGKFIPFISEEEKNVTVQLSGSKPDEFKEAIEVIEKKYPFIKGFNINAGCPSHTTMKAGAGSALMKNYHLLFQIIKECKKETTLPVSVKTRIFSEKEKTIEFYKGIEDSGADFLIVHGRTVKQGYSGNVDWNIIKTANEEMEIPVVGNGNVRNLEEGKEKIKNGFCSGIMIGRAALQNPRVFEGKNELTNRERIETALEYYKICENLGLIDLNNIKLVYSQIFKGMKNASKLREEIMKSKSIEKIKDLLDELEKNGDTWI
ncbi:MAG: tRNA-dihydrouridine synthase family protein [Candidatus Micrarchaeia archaeon]